MEWMMINLILRVPENSLEYIAGTKGKLSISNSSGMSLAFNPKEKRIYRDANGAHVIDIEQSVAGPIGISLVDDAVGKICFPGRVICRENAVEGFADRHQMIIVSEVRLELLRWSVGGSLSQRNGRPRSPVGGGLNLGYPLLGCACANQLLVEQTQLSFAIDRHRGIQGVVHSLQFRRPG